MHCTKEICTSVTINEDLQARLATTDRQLQSKVVMKLKMRNLVHTSTTIHDLQQPVGSTSKPQL